MHILAHAARVLQHIIFLCLTSGAQILLTLWQILPSRLSSLCDGVTACSMRDHVVSVMLHLLQCIAACRSYECALRYCNAYVVSRAARILLLTNSIAYSDAQLLANLTAWQAARHRLNPKVPSLVAAQRHPCSSHSRQLSKYPEVKPHLLYVGLINNPDSHT